MDRIELLATVPENYIYSREEEIETILGYLLFNDHRVEIIVVK